MPRSTEFPLEVFRRLPLAEQGELVLEYLRTMRANPEAAAHNRAVLTVCSTHIENIINSAQTRPAPGIRDGEHIGRGATW